METLYPVRNVQMEPFTILSTFFTIFFVPLRCFYFRRNQSLWFDSELRSITSGPRSPEIVSQTRPLFHFASFYTNFRNFVSPMDVAKTSASSLQSSQLIKLPISIVYKLKTSLKVTQKDHYKIQRKNSIETISETSCRMY